MPIVIGAAIFLSKFHEPIRSHPTDHSPSRETHRLSNMVELVVRALARARGVGAGTDSGRIERRYV